MVERDNTIYAIAVKSGTSVFNADSRKKQEQNFMAASKLAQQAKKRFVPIVGYGYGKKKTSTRGLPKFYIELAGKDFWTELTGDEEFYIKLIRFMDKLPEKYVEEFDAPIRKRQTGLSASLPKSSALKMAALIGRNLLNSTLGINIGGVRHERSTKECCT